LIEGVYAMDAEGNVFPMNTRAQQLLDEDLVVPILLEASTGQDVVERIQNKRLDTSPQSEPDMIPHTVLVSAHPLRDEDSKIVGSFAVMRVDNEQEP